MVLRAILYFLHSTMARRPKLKANPSPVTRDIEAPDRFFTSGCLVLDLLLGGKGYARGKVINILGESATGKTLLGIEAEVCFQRKFPDGKIYHSDTEAAYDEDYAERLGSDPERVELLPDVGTVEDLADFFSSLIEERKADEARTPCLLVLDSLDALTTRAELGRTMETGTFGLEKPKLLAQLFRRYIREMNALDVTLIIMSQVRSNINAGPFGKTTIQSGGKALRFYCSQVVELTHMKQLKVERKKIGRTVGIQVRARMEKSRFGTSHLAVEFPLTFGYGVDDDLASLQYLVRTNQTGLVGLKGTLAEANKRRKELDTLSHRDYAKARREIRRATRKAWRLTEELFKPKRTKYGKRIEKGGSV